MKRKRFGLASVVMLMNCLLLMTSPRAVGQDRQAGPGDEKQRTIVEAARQYARTVAGDDEASPEFYRVFQYAIEGAKGHRARTRLLPGKGTVVRSTPADERVVSPFAQAREAATDRPTERRSIFTDPTWLRNEKLRRERALRDDPGRIFGGKTVTTGDLADCVAVQGDTCICTGTLIGPNVVITAGHCDAGGCVDRIFIGNDVSQSGRSIKVKKSIRHPGFNSNTLTNDLTLLILNERVTDIAPRPLAQGAEVDGSPSLQLAGFGLTESGGLGRKFTVEVAIATATCGVDVSGGFGCHQDKEMVAGGNGHDSCNGDSGGPAYVQTDSGLKLAGTTSRATANATVNCGDGGIYVRVDRYLDWIRHTAKDNGGELP